VMTIINKWRLLALLIVLFPSESESQTQIPSALSLEQAVEIAQNNNPNIQSIRNDQNIADWEVRSAYGSLIPTATTSGGASWQGSGEQQFGSLTAGQLGFSNQPSYLFSNYNVGLNYQISGAAFMAPGQAKANREATKAQVKQAETSLILDVTQGYIEILRQIEQTRVSEQQLERAQFNLELARAQLEVGTATAVDVAQAEVALGRAEISVLQVENNFSNARIRLLQKMGVGLNNVFNTTTTFSLSAPTWNPEELYALGVQQNPNLQSLRASRSSANYTVKMAKSTYFPTISMRAGISGFTRQASNIGFSLDQAASQAASATQSCTNTNILYSRLSNPLPARDCSGFAITDEMTEQIRRENSQFPFNFTGQPASAAITVSLPLFQGLNRNRQLAEANVRLEDLDLNLKEQDLALRADIETTLATIRAAYQSALIDERNQTVVDEQLRLARERFREGLASFLELLEAETLKVEADRAQIEAIFAYHDFLTNLEAVVGTSLRIK